MQAIQNALQKWLFPIAQKLETTTSAVSERRCGCDHSDHNHRFILYDSGRLRKPFRGRFWSLGQ